MNTEEKLRKALGDKYKEWHLKEVQVMIHKGYDENKIIKSYAEKILKKR